MNRNSIGTHVDREEDPPAERSSGLKFLEPILGADGEKPFRCLR